MSNFLFLRRAEVLVSDLKFAEPDFRIYFNIKFDYDEDPNDATIEILNLTNDTISKIKKADNIVVNAGYDADMGTVFEGDIQKVELIVDAPNRTLKIYALDASKEYLESTVNKSYAQGTNASYIIQDVLAYTGLEIGYFELNNDITYVNGKVISGSLRNVLKNIVINDCNSKLYITNGSIIIRPDGTGENIGFLLNSNTGLIESPSKIDKESTDNIQTADYLVKMLLNHRVRVDSIFQIESRTANGLFRVNKGTHTKNDYEFITECEVVAV